MKNLFLFCTFFLLTLVLQAQIKLEDWKFKTGDNPAWAEPSFDDASWATIKGTTIYENQGYDYNGYSWYRVRFQLPKSLREKAFLKDSLRVIVARVDDIDATYLNGVKIGGIGTFPDKDGNGAAGIFDALRKYTLPWNHPAIRWGKENVIAVRVYDGGGGGGLWGLTPSVGMVDLVDFVELNINAGGFSFEQKGSIQKSLKVENTYTQAIAGTLSIEVQSKQGEKVHSESVPISVNSQGSTSHTVTFPYIENARVQYVFAEKNTNKKITKNQITPYILTPPEAPTPKITNALVFGARPDNPFLWSVTATGNRPMIFKAKGLPKGLELAPKTGLITGAVAEQGDYKVTLIAENNLGKTSKEVTIKIGDKILLTPPLGWNSWNAWGMAVSDERVRQSANGMITSGLVNHGWTYINIDDGWQGERDADGNILTNEKFPDMEGLGDYLHSLGLKYGIYSSPGATSCGGLTGALNHEAQDVKTWASWGVDYIKYDWCSYTDYLKEKGKTQEDWTVEEQVHPFKLISDAIQENDRDIVLSVANWGMNNAWEWADQTGGQLWRTTGDIDDSWESLKGIGFTQETPASYTRPSGWGDPDMLIVGWVGWGEHLHQSELTPAEQYTHISLWSLLAAPLLIGCDLDRMDAFTYNLLANDEVIAINQDPLGKAAKVVYNQDDIMIWVKELHNGNRAVGIFNLADEDRKTEVNWTEIDLASFSTLRDAWRQQDLKMGKEYEVELEAHGVQLVVLGE